MTTNANAAYPLLRAMLEGHIRLEYAGNDKKAAEFSKRYKEVTGKKPTGPCFSAGGNKWSEQFRVYVNLAAEERAAVAQLLGKQLDQTPAQYQYRHYNYRFSVPVKAAEVFWGLIEMGFRLGDN